MTEESAARQVVTRFEWLMLGALALIPVGWLVQAVEITWAGLIALSGCLLYEELTDQEARFSVGFVGAMLGSMLFVGLESWMVLDQAELNWLESLIYLGVLTLLFSIFTLGVGSAIQEIRERRSELDLGLVGFWSVMALLSGPAVVAILLDIT